MIRLNSYYVDEEGFIAYEEETDVVPEESTEEIPLFESNVQAVDPSIPLDETVAPSVEAVPLEEGLDAAAAIVPLSSGDMAVVLSDDVYRCDGMVTYKLTVSGYGECTIVVPSAYEDDLTCENGMIINWSSTNITVPLYVGDVADRPAASTLMITFLGRASSSYANNVYRYGSPQYVTSYSTNSSGSLSSTQTYVSISDADQVGWSIKFWFSLIIVVCLLLMGLNALIRFLRRGVRG